MSHAVAEHPPQHALEAQRQAYNCAFEELGLAWHWDAQTHRRVHEGHSGREGLRAYLQSEHAHLLRAYDADFLLDAIEAARDRYLR